MSGLFHYASRAPEQIFSVEQTQGDCGDFSCYDKPAGFWITDESEYSWRNWCVAEEFMLSRLEERVVVELSPDARLLRLDCYGDLLRFQDEFKHSSDGGADRIVIDWRRVASEFAGIMIFPYIWQARLDLNWYYPWDCASGCIWDARAIASVCVDEEYSMEASAA